MQAPNGLKFKAKPSNIILNYQTKLQPILNVILIQQFHKDS